MTLANYYNPETKSWWQYEEGNAPEGCLAEAEYEKRRAAKTKQARRPANKARTTSTKQEARK